ncbi:MAG: methyltransferase domain-containing protein [Desulfobacteraceae bacterium]|nr:methyltransferase domain-containing protein [Desulfobacteraceae bacterium]MCP4347432.1 methyltransferase domain-containing protein [Desulfobacterales bacterium]
MDDTAFEYDDLYELLHAWYYSRIHYIIAEHVIKKYRPKTVLDVACGTGLQTLLHSAGGAYSIGIDIAKSLIHTAKNKKLQYDRNHGLELFHVYFDFVEEYNKIIAQCLNINGNFTFQQPDFMITDAGKLPFKDCSFDHINFVGALSFMDNYDAALSEIKRVLKTGGTFFVDAESRWSFHIMWRIINYFLNDFLKEHTSINDIRSLLLTHPAYSTNASYPYKAFGKLLSVEGRFFTLYELKHTLKDLGFSVLGRWSVHSATSFIPWAYLNIGHPSDNLKKLFSLLAGIEEKLPCFLPGLGLAVLFQKQ